MFIYKRCRCRVSPGKYKFSQNQISALEGKLKLLGVKARLEILLQLEEGSHCVCDLMSHTKLSQSLISHHLSDLTSAGFIENKKEGKFVEYLLTDKGKELLTVLKGLTN
jgi:ArsR family transcriptional regulator, lead/cadmium/zinc/bismuth-responsive transcriptional repressor